MRIGGGDSQSRETQPGKTIRSDLRNLMMIDLFLTSLLYCSIATFFLLLIYYVFHYNVFRRKSKINEFHLKSVLSFYLHFFPPKPELLETVLVIHHGDDLLLVMHRHRSYGDVPDYSELSAVVEMLVLQTDEIPNKSPEDLQELKNTVDGFCWK